MLQTEKKNLTGERFERLIAVEPLDIGLNCRTIWLCYCDCGNDCFVKADFLIRRNTLSCGCLRRELLRERGQKRIGKLNHVYKHGLSGTKEYRNKYYQEKQKDYYRIRNLKIEYGLTEKQYETLKVKQDYCCAICGLNESDLLEMSGRGLGVDHNHKTGKIRGLLCDSCNLGLGTYEKMKRLNAERYLKKHLSK